LPAQVSVIEISQKTLASGRLFVVFDYPRLTFPFPFTNFSGRCVFPSGAHEAFFVVPSGRLSRNWRPSKDRAGKKYYGWTDAQTSEETMGRI
jgi:hypothetical protein